MTARTCLFMQPQATTPVARGRLGETAYLIKSAIKQTRLTLLGEDPNTNDAAIEREGVMVITISSELIEQVHRTDIVVVDVSCYENEKTEGFSLSPYLFYFTALSHSLGNKTILVTDSINHLPHSLITHHTLVYQIESTPRETERFYRNFEKAVNEIATNNDKPDNPIREYYKELKAKGMEQRMAELEAETAMLKRQADLLKKKEAEVRSSEERAHKIVFRPLGQAGEVKGHVGQ